MSKVCDLSGKRVQFGNNVSKANNKTRRKFNPNMQSATFKSELLNKSLKKDKLLLKIVKKKLYKIKKIFN